MNFENENFKSKIRYWTIFLGVLQVTVGCIVGLIPPNAVAYFRGIVSAHIEYTANGVLMIVLGLILNEAYLGRRLLWAWFAALQIGSWCNGLSALVAAFSGSTSKLTPTMNEKFPPTHGTDNPLAMALLVICAIGTLFALFITLYGLIKTRAKIGKIVESPAPLH